MKTKPEIDQKELTPVPESQEQEPDDSQPGSDTYQNQGNNIEQNDQDIPFEQASEERNKEVDLESARLYEQPVPLESPKVSNL